MAKTFIHTLGTLRIKDQDGSRADLATDVLFNDHCYELLSDSDVLVLDYPRVEVEACSCRKRDCPDMPRLGCLASRRNYIHRVWFNAVHIASKK